MEIEIEVYSKDITLHIEYGPHLEHSLVHYLNDTLKLCSQPCYYLQCPGWARAAPSSRWCWGPGGRSCLARRSPSSTCRSAWASRPGGPSSPRAGTSSVTVPAVWTSRSSAPSSPPSSARGVGRVSSYQSTLTGRASGGAGQPTSHTQLLTSQSKHSHFLIHRRFCNDPYDLEMIIEIIDTIEKQLDEISKNPSVKLYENFLRRNSQTLHIKHYLNLIGEILEILNKISFKNLFSSSKAYCWIIVSWMWTNEGDL